MSEIMRYLSFLLLTSLYTQVLSRLSQMARSHSFLWLSSILLRVPRFLYPLIFLRNLHMFSIVAAPIHNPTNGIRGRTKLEVSHSLRQTILQSYSDQNSILGQENTHRQMEQNWEPINKSTHMWTINLWQRSQEQTKEKGQFLQQVLGKLDGPV